MKKLFQSMTGGYASSAKVVDGALILSLPDALSPVVWRMDLGQVHSSALEVREQDNGTYMLTLKTTQKDVQQIAPFAARGPALRALMAASRALEQGQGRSRAAAANNDMRAAAPAPTTLAYAPPRSGGIGKWFLAVVASLMLVAVFIGMRGYLQPPTGSLTGERAAASAGLAGAGATGAPANAGMPVSADEFLRTR